MEQQPHTVSFGNNQTQFCWGKRGIRSDARPRSQVRIVEGSLHFSQHGLLFFHLNLHRVCVPAKFSPTNRASEPFVELVCGRSGVSSDVIQLRLEDLLTSAPRGVDAAGEFAAVFKVYTYRCDKTRARARARARA